MSNLNGLYDENAEVAGDFEVFEAGVYPTQLIESDIAPTSAGTGKLFKYKAEIVDGEHKGRLVFGQMNLQNPNATATKIGQGEFAALRLVTGVASPEDTADLHFKAFEAAIEIEPAKTDKGKTYKARNVINWGKTAKLFQGEDVTVAAPAAANDNVAGAAPANDNKPAAAVKPKPAAGGKGAWPKKAA